MPEGRKLAAIVVTDIVGYSRMAAADEDRTLARLKGLRSDLIDPAATPFATPWGAPIALARAERDRRGGRGGR